MNLLDTAHGYTPGYLFSGPSSPTRGWPIRPSIKNGGAGRCEIKYGGGDGSLEEEGGGRGSSGDDGERAVGSQSTSGGAWHGAPTFDNFSASSPQGVTRDRLTLIMVP